MKALAQLAILGALCGALCSCAAEGREAPASWLEQAKDAHRAADQALSAGDHTRARAALEAALSVHMPAEVSDDDRRAVKQDLLYRLADLEIGAGQPSQAIEHAEQGLALGAQQDLFTANLYIVRGRALQAQGDERMAAHDFYEALQINSALLRQTLGAEGVDPQEDDP